MVGPGASTAPRRVVLTERDVELLLSMYRYRYLSMSQVERLHFPSAQTATRRVRLLEKAGYLATFRVPGVPERVVRLADQGAEAVGEALEVGVDELGWKGVSDAPKDYYFLRHFLAAGDFRISLARAAEREPGVDLLGFLPEHVGVRTRKGGLQKYIRDVVADIERPRGSVTHTPDGVFALQKNGSAALFFLEVDRGTENLKHRERGFAKTLRFYLSYLVGEGYQRYQDDFRLEKPFRAFRVLIVTTSVKRLENIRKVGTALPVRPAHAKRFLWLAPEVAVAEETIFSPIWVSLDAEDRSRYAIAGSHGRSS